MKLRRVGDASSNNSFQENLQRQAVAAVEARYAQNARMARRAERIRLMRDTVAIMFFLSVVLFAGWAWLARDGEFPPLVIERFLVEHFGSHSPEWTAATGAHL